MTARLSHRGPDAQGHSTPVPGVGLGHARLKVIDLSPAANQPMADPAGRTWLVYNGEIYNYRSLRGELEGAGRRFVTRSDTEVILHAYEEWGDAALERLDGMFAIALVDTGRRRLLLARDRTGKKPLFYYRDARRWVFGSEIKAILAHPDVPSIVNEAAIPGYLVYGYSPSPETFYRGIRSVPPASLLALDWAGGGVAERRYWRLRIPERPSRVPRAQAIAELRERLTGAVRKRLIADVPLGAFLSGGVDSSIVVGLMSREMQEPVHTFSIGFRNAAEFDETPHARVIADRFRTRHTEFMVEPNAFGLLERLVHHHDQPFGDASAIPTFLLCGLAREHVTVALNGDGGDECFAGYRRFAAAALSAWLPAWANTGIDRVLGHDRLRVLRRFRPLGELARFARAARRPWDERLMRWIAYWPDPCSILHPGWRGKIIEADWLSATSRWLEEVRGASPLAQALYVNFHEYLPGDLHVKMDRCSMAHGLETRSPFLDTGVIEYAMSLPDRLKLRGMTTKAVLKDAFADLLPPSIRRRAKQGFGVPLDAWFRRELKEAVSDLLLARDARVNRYLDPAAVRAAWSAHQSGERSLGLQLWNLATLEVWLRMPSGGGWTGRASPADTGVVRRAEVRG
jgi:asparagine synthase (glutamine-hydrolysing)